MKFKTEIRRRFADDVEEVVTLIVDAKTQDEANARAQGISVNSRGRITDLKEDTLVEAIQPAAVEEP